MRYQVTCLLLAVLYLSINASTGTFLQVFKIARSTLRCPAPQPRQCILTSQRSDQCRHSFQCQIFFGPDFKCCFNGCRKTCVKGIEPAPRDGECTADTTIPDVACIQDRVRCIYDSECPDGEKCCETEACDYSQCKPINVEPTPHTSTLTCPGQQLFFCPDNMKGVRPCEQNSDCTEADNLCCHMECGKRCEKGVDTTPKVGTCPNITEQNCLQDFGGCSHDSECSGEEKCCRVTPCGYGQCSPPEQVEPTPRTSTLTCPGQQLFFCPDDMKGVRPCEQDSDCTEDDNLCCHMECGKRCEEGVDTTPKAGTCPNITEQNCRQDFVGCSHDSECAGEQKCCRVNPCGYGQCSSPEQVEPTPPSSTLTCPAKQFFFCPDDMRGVRPCDQDSDCTEDDNLCCHMECGKRCEEGVDTTSKVGTCPNIAEQNCRQDFVGCSHDSECFGEKKCCRVNPCGYGRCSAPEQAEPTPPTSTLTCPRQQLFFCPDNMKGVRPCEQDSDCTEADNLCCQMECGKRCEEGVDTTPKDGVCPVINVEQSACRLDYSGCDADSSCPNTQKCCLVKNCGYKQCADV